VASGTSGGLVFGSEVGAVVLDEVALREDAEMPSDALVGGNSKYLVVEDRFGVGPVLAKRARDEAHGRNRLVVELEV
jgi:hypothetical protein